MLKILHTSDWHLGRSLYGQNRHAEFAAFLDWLMQTLQQERVDVLMIAGDVFDTITPNHAAQELYYRFLAQVSAYCLCRHIIIIGGNHDSASFLNAPKALLFALNVHVIGAATQPIDKEVLVLKNSQGEAAAIVCAVPYLRDRDVRVSVDGESSQDKSLALVNGIKAHYRQTLDLAQQKQQALGSDVPIIAMGHLFSQGGMTLDADGVRELYVGSLAHIGADCFDGFDYVALGHIHTRFASPTQRVQYSGSPVAFNVKEAKRKEEKGVYILELDASGDMSQTFHTLEVKRPIVALQESFETLMSPEFYKNQPCQKAWFAFDIQLSSRKELEGINVRARLEEIYGTDIVEITFSRLGDVREENLTVDQHLKDLEMQSPQEIVFDFYQTVTGGDVLSERQTALVESVFEEIERSRQ